MLCGSVSDFAVLVSKISYLEKKIKALQKSVKTLAETLEKNQEEVRSYLRAKEGIPLLSTPSKGYCSVRL